MKKALFTFFSILFFAGCSKGPCTVFITGKLTQGGAPFSEMEYAGDDDDATVICEEYRNDPIFSFVKCTTVCD